MMVELATLRGDAGLRGGATSAWGLSPAWGRRVVVGVGFAQNLINTPFVFISFIRKKATIGFFR